MGGAVGVERNETLRYTLNAAPKYTQATNALAHFGRNGGINRHVFSHIHRIVEKHIVRRINLLASYIQSASKFWVVASISTTSIAEAYDIDLKDVCKFQVSKRDYEVYKCCPELQDVPSWKKVAHVLELQDFKVTEFLLSKCRWTVWQPSTSWRIKVDHVFNITVHVAVRQEGFLTGEIRVLRLRLGRKWIGAHLLSEGMAYSMKTQWLHRVDYEVGDQVHIAESNFFKTVKEAWEVYIAELAKVPQEIQNDVDSKESFLYLEQEKQTSLRVKYLLDTALENILNDRRTMFWMPHQYELWRMEQEDAFKYRQTGGEYQMAGPLLLCLSEELIELYEKKGMAAEDADIPWL